MPPELASDGDLIVRDALRWVDAPARRVFMQRGLTLGGLSLLSGCSLVDGESVENLLGKVSRFNDRVQAAIFSSTDLAPTYPDSMITRPFPFNAY